MAISNEEYALLYERASAIYDALVAGLPDGEPEGDALKSVGELSGALEAVAADYVALKLVPSSAVMDDIAAYNSTYDDLEMIAVEKALAAIH